MNFDKLEKSQINSCFSVLNLEIKRIAIFISFVLD